MNNMMTRFTTACVSLCLLTAASHAVAPAAESQTPPPLTETVEVTPPWVVPLQFALGLLLAAIFLAVYLRTLRSERTLLAARLRTRTRELEERGRQYQALFDNAAVSVMVHDPDSMEVLQASEKALASYGVDSVEALNHAAFVSRAIWSEPPYSLQEARELFQRTREAGPQRFEWRTRRLDGSEIWEDVFLRLVPVGGRERIVSTAVDITARKRAEAKLVRQLEMEGQVREISLRLLNCGVGGTGDGITNAITRLGENMAASRCSLLDYSDETGGFNLFLQWCAPGTGPLEADFHIPAVVVAPYQTRLIRGEAVIVSRDRAGRDSIEYSLLEAGGAQSVLCLPILRDGTLEGILILSFPEPRPSLRPAEIRPLQVSADLIGAALARKRLAGELEHQASHDVLTGLNNRRKFEELLLQEIERTNRYQRPFAVIMFDIDHFKRINDRHGHDVGDAVLSELAAIVREQVRDTDIPARWGGEEFIVLLPETGIEGAGRAAEGLRRRIAGTLFTGAGRVTISLGVTQYQPGDSLDSLVKRADEALYRAKGEGRNRVVVT
ncbi:hypothetical protein TspCOW1_09880 [Thiohalobacter sp. COW1]|nr:hypothetical protein TspCOW1_09880 [Thiohalobacter sp. COW1]